MTPHPIWNEKVSDELGRALERGQLGQSTSTTSAARSGPTPLETATSSVNGRAAMAVTSTHGAPESSDVHRPNSPPAEPSWWERTRARARETTLGQAVLGVGYGVQASFTPGGFLAPNPSHEPAFQAGRGLGEMAGGVIQMVGGGAMTGAGTGLAAGGVAAEGPSLGTSTVVVMGGAALATAGVAVSAHGAVNVAAGASQIINAARGSGDGSPEPKNAPSGGGQDAVARGAEREARVAELVGGKVSREQIRTRFGGSDIDVIGPKGELIAVGGPAKANNLSKLGTQLKVLKEAAAVRGVPAKAAFEKGTPQSAIDLAVKKLGAENVFVF